MSDDVLTAAMLDRVQAEAEGDSLKPDENGMILVAPRVWETANALADDFSPPADWERFKPMDWLAEGVEPFPGQWFVSFDPATQNRSCRGEFREWFRQAQIRKRLARRGRLHKARLERWYRNVR